MESLNVVKCRVMVVRSDIIDGCLHINDIPINVITDIRDLGIKYDSKLSLSKHIHEITNRATKTSNFICRNFHLNESKLVLYKMFVRPTLEFCSFSFTNAKQSDLVRIEKVQRKLTTRLVRPSSNGAYLDRCDALKIQPIWLRRLKLNLQLLYKVIHDIPNSRRRICLRDNGSSYQLRYNKHVLKIISAKCKIRTNFFLLRYRSLWNRLSEDIRSSRSFLTFQIKLKGFLGAKNAKKLLTKYDRNIDFEYEPGHI